MSSSEERDNHDFHVARSSIYPIMPEYLTPWIIRNIMQKQWMLCVYDFCANISNLFYTISIKVMAARSPALTEAYDNMRFTYERAKNMVTHNPDFLASISELYDNEVNSQCIDRQGYAHTVPWYIAKEKEVTEREIMLASKEQLFEETVAQKEAALMERENAIAERESLLSSREEIITETTAQKEAALLERENAIAERESLLRAREEIIIETAKQDAQQQSLLIEKEKSLSLREALLAENEAKLNQREDLASSSTELKAETTAKPKAETAAEPKAKPAAEPKPKAAAEPKPKAAAKPKSKPVAEPKAKLAAESKPKAAAEPKAKAAVKNNLLDSIPEKWSDITDSEMSEPVIYSDVGLSSSVNISNQPRMTPDPYLRQEPIVREIVSYTTPIAPIVYQSTVSFKTKFTVKGTQIAIPSFQKNQKMAFIKMMFQRYRCHYSSHLKEPEDFIKLAPEAVASNGSIIKGKEMEGMYQAIREDVIRNGGNEGRVQSEIDDIIIRIIPTWKSK